MLACQGDWKLGGEISPAGVSLTHWVDAYVNTLLNNVVQNHGDDKIRKTTENVGSSPPVSKDVDVVTFVDKIIAQSVEVVLSEEEEFANDLICEVLDKASQEILSEGGFDLKEHNLNEFVRGFIEDTIQKIAEADQFSKKAHAKTFEQSKKSSSAVLVSPCKKSRSIQDKGVLGQQGKDYIYVQHRLMSMLGKDVDSSIVRYVMGAVPQHGTWTTRFQAVEAMVGKVEKQQKSGHPFMTEFREMQEVAEKTTVDKCIGDVNQQSGTIKSPPLEVLPHKLARTKSTPGRARRIFMRMLRSLTSSSRK